MSSIEITVSIISGLVCLVIGGALGAMPLKSEQTTEEQNKYQQFGGIIACGLVIVLMLIDMNIASWIAIGGFVVGIIISRIPPIHKELLARFPMLKPAERKSPLTKPQKSKKNARKK